MKSKFFFILALTCFIMGSTASAEAPDDGLRGDEYASAKNEPAEHTEGARCSTCKQNADPSILTVPAYRDRIIDNAVGRRMGNTEKSKKGTK